MSRAKIQLSSFEKELVQNSDWILTKRSIIDKVYTLFGNLSEIYSTIIDKASVPAEIRLTAPKISRGENYYGLPYVVLDYPRIFDKENVFAIRTLFWWGNFFSSSFHIKGEYKRQFIQSIFSNYEQFLKAGYFLCTNDDEWDFRFAENNFKSINEISRGEWETLLKEKSFIKLSVKIPLASWDHVTDELIKFFQLNLQSAGINFRDGEINL
ncbi:MAG: hypothetical protein EKK37_11625 [Sphingobacteriales bacterium]|nr:MAG: hypothetical protein EKK37_11625 [Sphingobacteriales bacterium]